MNPFDYDENVKEKSKGSAETSFMSFIKRK